MIAIAKASDTEREVLFGNSSSNGRAFSSHLCYRR